MVDEYPVAKGAVELTREMGVALGIAPLTLEFADTLGIVTPVESAIVVFELSCGTVADAAEPEETTVELVVGM